MKKEDHLPVYGPGPLIGGVMIVLTVLGCIFRNTALLHTGRLEDGLKVLFIIAGITLIAVGIGCFCCRK